MLRFRYITAFGLFLLLSSVCLPARLSAQLRGQADRHEVRKGNRDFRKENYKEAEIDYRKALVKDSTSIAANYNLGNTLYRNGDMDQAIKSYEAVSETAPGSVHGADWYYNKGNAAASVEDWQGAVQAYAESLLRNPGDIDAKENYLYARSKLQDQQNNGGDGQNDQNQDQNDQNQDQNQNNDQNNEGDQNQDQNQDQNGDGQDNQDNQNDQNGQDQDDNGDGQEPPQQNNQSGQQSDQQPKITPQAAQQMLRAIQAKEKETQEKVNKEKAELMKSRQKEKNW